MPALWGGFPDCLVENKVHGLPPTEFDEVERYKHGKRSTRMVIYHPHDGRSG